ncbi:Coiled-coil domain-containing protein 190 [Galemys pyrenaicus]|uniref:Coiled-coil domain-containing protein 190 n=1 Tax=Galemys pyrenaicus TaxID=202257 RepID=A0A8J6DXZ0_GALPY|nr:Coiled-coil domain-containing protein 190 [Galemys pyrenaicus]
MRKWAHLSRDTGLNGRRHEDTRTDRTNRTDQQREHQQAAVRAAKQQRGTIPNLSSAILSCRYTSAPFLSKGQLTGCWKHKSVTPPLDKLLVPRGLGPQQDRIPGMESQPPEQHRLVSNEATVATSLMLDRHMVRGPVYKHFDVERKNAKQAEARLSQKLQRLEVVCLYHVKLLTREQRQLQKELQRLQQAIIKKKFSSCFGDGIQKIKEDIPVSSPQGRQKNRVPQASNIRASEIIETQEANIAKPLMPPAHHTGLKFHMKGKKQSLPQNHRTSHLIKEKPQVQEEESVVPPKGKESSNDTATLYQDQEVPTNTSDPGPTSSPAAESTSACVNGARSEEANLEPDLQAGKQISPSPMECAGKGKGPSTEPTYLELFMRVRNAHYLRHRVPPESERLLSIREIFGHEEPLEPRAAKDRENGETT